MCAVCAALAFVLAGCPNSSTGGGTPATPPTITLATGVTCAGTVGVTVSKAKIQSGILTITICVTCNGAALKGVPTSTAMFTKATADELELQQNNRFRAGVSFPATDATGCTTRRFNISNTFAGLDASDLMGQSFNVQVKDATGAVVATGSGTIS